MTSGIAHADGPFGNETISRPYNDLPSHSQLTVDFEIDLHDSWDGDSRVHGPDSFRARVQDGSTLVDTFLSARRGRRYRFRRSFSHSGSSVTFLFSSSTTDTEEKWSLRSISVTPNAASAASAWIVNGEIEPSYKFSNNRRTALPTGARGTKEVHTVVTWFAGRRRWIHGPTAFRIIRSNSNWSQDYTWNVPSSLLGESAGNADVTTSMVYDIAGPVTDFPVTRRVAASSPPAPANSAVMNVTYHLPFEEDWVRIVPQSNNSNYEPATASSDNIPAGGASSTTGGPFWGVREHSRYTLESSNGDSLEGISVAAGIIGAAVGVVSGGAGAALSIAASVGSFAAQDQTVPARERFEFNNNITLFQRSLQADGSRDARERIFVRPPWRGQRARANPQAAWPTSSLRDVSYRQYYQKNEYGGKFYDAHGYRGRGTVRQRLPVNAPVAMGHYELGAPRTTATTTTTTTNQRLMMP